MSMAELSESSPSQRNSSIDEKTTQQLFYLMNMNLLYDGLTSNGLGCVVTDAEVFANRVIQRILTDGSSLLYDKYLNSKMTDHSLSHNTYLVELIMKQELIFYDDRSSAENEIIHEDSEPHPSHHENWKAFSVALEKQEHPGGSNLYPSINKEADLQSVSQHSRKSIQYDKSRKSDAFLGSSLGGSANRGSTSKSLFEGDKTLKIVDLSVPREIIREEEQLRVLKERESLIKQEKMQLEAIRSQELKEQQARLRGMQDVNKKMFTYDFDGKFILTNPVKTDKLPPFNYAVNSQVTKVDAKPVSTAPANATTQKEGAQQGSSGNSNQNSMQPQTQKQQEPQIEVVEEKRNSRRLNFPQGQGAAAVNNQGQDRTGGQFYGGIGDGKEMFDEFKMASGVTLIDPIKQKRGPNFGANLDTTTLNSSMLNTTLSQNGNTIRMTRNEYNAVIKSGNLIKSQLQPIVQNNNNNTKNTLTFDESLQHNDSMNAQFHPNGQSFMLLNNNDSRLKNNQSMNYSRLKKASVSQHEHSTIIISDRSKFIESMSSLDQISDQQLKELEAIRAKQEKYASERKAASAQSLMKNPNDEFNMLIYQNKHISDKKNGGNYLPPLITPRPNEYLRAKQAIGFLTQNPRDRAPRHVINASVFHTRLPPPGMGKTLGHGLDQGFNPEKLESLEGILERIQNTSINNASQNQK